MNTLHTLQVTGTLMARQPLAVSPPGAAWANDGKNSPARLPSFGYGQAAVRYIPASTMRHVIRYGIAQVIQSALAQQGRNLSLDQLLALDKGFVSQKKNPNKNGKGKKAKDEPAVENNAETGEAGVSDRPQKKKSYEILQEEIRLRERNPLLGMLGLWGVPSELRVLNVIPVSSPAGASYTVASGLTRKGLESVLVEGLSEEDRALYMSKLDAWSDDAKESTGLKHFSDQTWEEIVQGTTCDWGYLIHRANPVKSGSVLAALRLFACDPVIGAHRAVGRGEVEIQLQARMIEQSILSGPSVQEAGSVHVARGLFEVTGELAEHLRIFDEAVHAGFPDMDLGMIPDPNGGED